MLAVSLLVLEAFAFGIVFAGKPRMQHFNKEHMDQFEAEHKATMPDSAPVVGGWPDAGEGRYAAKLSYKSWATLNNAFRVQVQTSETLPTYITVFCLAGLYLPLLTLIAAYCNVVGRLIFAVMYSSKGANWRVIGSLLGNLPLYSLMLGSFVYIIVKIAE